MAPPINPKGKASGATASSSRRRRNSSSSQQTTTSRKRSSDPAGDAASNASPRFTPPKATPSPPTEEGRGENGGDTVVTPQQPESVALGNVDKQCVIELNQQAMLNRETWVDTDLISRVRARASKVLFRCFKFPQFTPTGGGRIERQIMDYIQKELELPDREFEKKWVGFRQEITKVMRTKRAAVVQVMKHKMMGGSSW